MSLDVMKQALDALESNPDAMVDRGDGHWDFKRDLAITALRAAIEQPRQWQGLTDEEIENMMDYWSEPARSAYGGAHTANGEYVCIADIIRDAEARLKEKNHG